MDDGDPAEAAVVDHVHRVPVGEARDEQLREVGERRLVVERARELLARLCEDAQALASSLGGGACLLAVGHIGDDDADADHRVRGVADRVVADQPVSRLGGRVGRSPLDGKVEDRLAGLEHVPVVRLDRSRQLVPDHVADRAPEMLLRGKPVDAGEGVVHADVVKARVHERQADRRGGEHRVDDSQRLLRMLTGRLCFPKELRVVDRYRSAPRKVVRRGEI